ncbi:unnamed protein product [Phaedon cochleariae]|uniref:Gem-associated protein 5 n=1 Tax=Phaedon cochleariae TaxID=80249 RepID=A0A9P0DT89_PHACE|nr:unnamed protein product [Phaedon cochleariae]
MNTLVVPPSPNWYESSILACAPDNTVIYGARNDLVLIENSDVPNQASKVDIISRAHSQKILSVHINKNWGKPNKFVVSVSEDKIIKVWNVETLKKHASHNEHLAHSKVVGANFAGDDRIISVSEDGVIVVWNVGANKTIVLKDVFGFKATVTCLSTCPHAPWMTAFGLKNGLVLVTDLRRNGTLLHRLRGHDKPVLSLSWCPAPINIFPTNPRNCVGIKKETLDSNDKSHLPAENESSAVKDSNDQNGSESRDDNTAKNDTHPLLKVYDSNDEDSSQVFQDLKDKILGNSSPEDVESETDVKNVLISRDGELKLEDENAPLTVADSILNGSEYKLNDFLKECQDLESKIKEIRDESDILLSSTSKYTNPFKILCSDIPIEKMSDAVNTIEDLNIKTDGISSEPCEKLELPVEEKGEITENISSAVQSSEHQIISTSANTNDTEESQTVDQDQDEVESAPVIEVIDKQSTELRTDETKVDVETKTDEQRCVDDSPAIHDEKTVNGMKTCEEVGRKITTKEIEEEQPRKEYLLASAAREGNIYIWRAGSDGRMQNFMCVPNINKSSHRRSSSSFDKIWITLCWASPTTLLSSSRSSELLQWPLPKPMDKSKQMSLVHKDHNTLLFSIAAPVSYSDEFNWLEKRQMNAWTLGQDRLLLNTSLCNEKTNLACYPTFGGSVHCLQLSPVDPNRLAIGSADGFIRILDLSRPHVKQIIMTTFYQKIQSRVESLAWHPENELLLAFGTSEGRVGYLDSNNTSKSPVLLPHFFKSQIYKLEWGPIPGNKQQFGLYAVAEGKLVVFNTSKKSENEPTEIDKPEKTIIYSFAWKPDYSILLVSTKAGFLIVYSPELKILRKHYFPQRIQEILWHPNAALHGDSPAQAQSCWFAAITNFKNVTVYDFDEARASDSDDDRVVAVYEGAGDVVSCISWSPHKDYELVIGNENGIVQIWDTNTKEFISTYVTPNFAANLTALWSPVDPDFMISGSRDSALRIWRISEHAPKNEIELMETRKTVLKKMMIESADLLPKIKKPQDSATIVKKTNKNVLLPKFPIAAGQSVDGLRKLLQWKEDPSSVESSTENGGELTVFDVFGTNKDMLKLVNTNETVHKQNGKYSLNAMLTMFRGDLSSTIKEAIDEKRVDQWIISLAPMVSSKLWQAACETYAHQLSEQSDTNPLEVATYFLACHKVEQAINCLCEAQMFKEALALAKCRFTENDVAVQEVLDKWAKHSVYVGNFEIAAQCFIVLGKYEEAASVLFRRSDIETMEFAAELAEKSGNVELHKAALFRYKSFLAESSGENGDKEKQEMSTIAEISMDGNEIVGTANGDENLSTGTSKNIDNLENVSQEEILPRKTEKDDANKTGDTDVVQEHGTEEQGETDLVVETANEDKNPSTETSRNMDNVENVSQEEIVLQKTEKDDADKTGDTDVVVQEQRTDIQGETDLLIQNPNEEIPQDDNALVPSKAEETLQLNAQISQNKAPEEIVPQKTETEDKTVKTKMQDVVEENNEGVSQNGTPCLVPNVEKTLSKEETNHQSECASGELINTDSSEKENDVDKTEEHEGISKNQIPRRNVVEVHNKEVPQNGTVCLLPNTVDTNSVQEENLPESESANGIKMNTGSCEKKNVLSGTNNNNEGIIEVETLEEEIQEVVQQGSEGKKVAQKSTSRNKKKHRKH